MRKKSNSLAAHPLIAALLGIAIMAFWLLFTGSFDLHELMLGGVFTLVTLILTALAWRDMGVFFIPTLKQLACLWRLPWYVLRDSIQVTIVLLEDITGIRSAGSHFRAVRFPCSGSRLRERIVLATAGITVTPSTIVLGVTDDHLLYHELKRSPVPQMILDLRDLGARQ